ncbi:MAG TPA: ATP-dependent DNA ligase [Chthoniobacterales bacterium]
MIDVRYEWGVRLPVEHLWLDPRGPRELAFVSHAHSDHTGRHREAILTEATSRLMQARMGDPAGREHVLAYRERRRIRSFDIELLPAGHVLGSAQCLVTTDAGTLLYTGDFKLRPGLSAEPAEAAPADTLIMETTFGLPRYAFPPAEKVVADVVKFCLEAREDGATPVLLGYSLGKAQEILFAVAAAGLPIRLHGSVWSMSQVYESMGVKFPPYEKYVAGAAGEHVLICPPSVAGSAMLRKIRNRRVAVMTGWAMDGGAAHRYQADAAFPLSDHADYPDLLRYVEMVRPRRVLTLHGFAREFARDLRARGIEAWALTAADQLEFALGAPATTVAVPREVLGPVAADHGFSGFSAVCEKIAAATGKLVKVQLLADYLARLDDEELPLAATWLTGRAFPQAAARPLQLGGAIIRRALLAASGLSPSDLQAISRRHNDAGLTAEEALAANVGGEALPLAAVHAFFTQIEQARGPLAKGALLEERLRRLSAQDAKTLVKILTGDLRIGLKEGLVEDAVAAAFSREPEVVREAHMLLGDLGETALRARRDALVGIALQPFRPVKCMLASPEPDEESVWDRMTAGGATEVWVEDKLDGIRAQLHCAGGDAAIYSRDLRPITKTFPEIAEAAVRTGVEFVLDGEIVAWRDGRPLSFFELQKRLGRVERDLFMETEVPVTFTAFDVLWMNGRSVFREPLAERRKILEALPLAAPLRTLPLTRAQSAEEVEIAFVVARGRNNEGLIVKDPGSRYAPGRRGLAWVKLKKAFATLDVVVTSVEYGHGRRKGVLSDYTFAVRDEVTGELLNIGKAYSGLTDAEIAAFTERFLGMIVRQRGRVYDVRPEVVLEVAFDSIQPSARHASGLALRFPRIHRIRADKTVAEIDTVASARRLLPPEASGD